MSQDDCYHRAMAAQLLGHVGYIYPEQFRWLKKYADTPFPTCTEKPCTHWPIFTVCEGSPYPPYYGKPECYMGFRSDPRPLLGVLRLNTPAEDEAVLISQMYLRDRLGHNKS